MIRYSETKTLDLMGNPEFIKPWPTMKETRRDMANNKHWRKKVYLKRRTKYEKNVDWKNFNEWLLGSKKQYNRGMNLYNVHKKLVRLLPLAHRSLGRTRKQWNSNLQCQWADIWRKDQMIHADWRSRLNVTPVLPT